MTLSRTILSLLASSAAADLSTKVDPIMFGKLMRQNKASTGTMIVHFKKRYGYDSKDVTEKINRGTQTDMNLSVYDVEIPEKKAEDADTSPEDGEPDAAEAAGGDPDDEDGQAEPGTADDHSKKEKIEDKLTEILIEDYKIEREKLPYIGIFKDGKQTHSMKVEEETEPSEVINWLEGQGISVMEGEVDLPEFESTLAMVAKVLNEGKSKDALSDALKEADTQTQDLDMETESTNTKIKSYVKALKTLAKKDKPVEYLATEQKRLGGLIASGAIAASKKKEMTAKISCLRAIQRKMKEATSTKEAEEKGTEL